MLSRIARGVPRFSITSERLSLSTRFSSLPKLDLARRAEITMPSLVAVLVIGMNSPIHLSELYSWNSAVHLFELYSYKFRLSMGSEGGSLPEARASRARRRSVSSASVRRRRRESQRRKSPGERSLFWEL